MSIAEKLMSYPACTYELSERFSCNDGDILAKENLFLSEEFAKKYLNTDNDFNKIEKVCDKDHFCKHLSMIPKDISQNAQFSKRIQKTSNMFREIENCFHGCYNLMKDLKIPFHIDKEELKSKSTEKDGVVSKKRRIRRSPDELKHIKKEVCPHVGCGKAYTSRCSLYLHIKRTHQSNIKEIYDENPSIGMRLKVKKGVDVSKVFKGDFPLKYFPLLDEAQNVKESEKNMSKSTSAIDQKEMLSRKSTACHELTEEIKTEADKKFETEITQDDFKADLFNWHKIENCVNEPENLRSSLANAVIFDA